MIIFDAGVVLDTPLILSNISPTLAKLSDVTVINMTSSTLTPVDHRVDTTMSETSEHTR